MAETKAERTINRVLTAIPGYTGYKDKERRRDADRAVRDRLVAELNQRAERVERLAQQAADQRRINDVGMINGAASAIRLLSNRINTATYGYGGLFGSKDVNAAVLDQIRLFDESLFAGLEQIDAAMTNLEGANADTLKSAAAEAQLAVDQLSARLDLRDRVIDSAVPATPEQMSNVLAVLQTPEERKAAESPPPAYELHDRDAIAILGDNYVVDARIDVESANGFFRLFRIDVGPDKWFFVPRRRGETFALLSPSSDAYVPGPQPAIGGTAYTEEASGHGSGDVVGAGGQTGRRPVAYTLLRGVANPAERAVVLQWVAEQQVMTGNEVHPDDVEIFGRPS